MRWNRSIHAFLEILNTNETVWGEADSYMVTGTNNALTIGDLWWTNKANQAHGALPVSGTTFEIPGMGVIPPSIMFLQAAPIVGLLRRS
ncbi:hypothetical protein P4C99_04660 [Pontiellaceae bacterium B1224]|nr:hypothetical protein [Pontiellaceae bacterium B1224]